MVKLLKLVHMAACSTHRRQDVGEKMSNKNALSEENTEAVDSVSVIIPTLNAEKELDLLLSALHRQEYPVREILYLTTAERSRGSRKAKLFTR